MELISSTSNPLVKQVRLLRQRKGRAESGLFVVEGIHHVGAAVEAGWDLETLIYAPDLVASDFARQLVDEGARRGVRLAALTRDLFAAIADKDNPQGLLAVVRQRSTGLDELAGRGFRWGAACVSPQDPGNVGTILRTLDAVGADALFLLDGGVDPYHPSAVRASMGAIFTKPLVRASFEEFAAWAHGNDCRLAGSSAHAATDYRLLKLGSRPLVLVLGSEQKGLSEAHLAACDIVVSLPMRGRASSLNLAVAAGVMLYSLLDSDSPDST